MFSLFRLCILGAVVTIAQAQTITATLTGTVRDPQGAAVPNATLIVTSAETSQQRAATSDREAVISFPPAARNL